MGLTKDGPFLREARRDFFCPICEENRHVQDVLNHARLLVVRFFNKERVVLDSLRERFGSRKRDE